MKRISTLLALVLFGCGSSGEADFGSGEPSRNVTQGGPQDIAEFRAVVARGEVPARALLDEVGFFAEHAVDLPPAECGAAVCLHPMLAVAPRFDGGNWSMAFVALNTGVDPATLPLAPRHLILVVDTSAATRGVLTTFSVVAQPLAAALTADDRVSVVFATPSPEVSLHGAGAAELAGVVLPPTQPDPTIDLYAGLGRALELGADPAFDGYSQRVLVFTTGESDTGVRELERFVALGERFAERAIAVSTFGMGTSYRREVPAELAEVASGNYYYAAGASDLGDAVAVEAETAFVPLARNLSLTLTAQPGYRVGRVYGARRSTVTETRVTIETPTLFIGARTGSDDVTTGRRGGGGGFFVELRADVPPDGGAHPAADAFTLEASFEDPASGAVSEFAATLSTPLGVGQNPAPDAPYFSQVTYAKPFMMLNMYLALGASVELFEKGDCGGALGIWEMMQTSYFYWARTYDDPDTDADYTLLTDLRRAIQTRCTLPPAQRVEYPLSCFMF